MIDATNTNISQTVSSGVNTVNRNGGEQSTVGGVAKSADVGTNSDGSDGPSIVTLGNGVKAALLTYTEQSLVAAAGNDTLNRVEDSSPLPTDTVFSFGGTKHGPP